MERLVARQYPDHPKYVPIIKWQKWEQRALKETKNDVSPDVLPCIEVRDSAQHETLMKVLPSTWSRPLLVDYANPTGRLLGNRAKELYAFLKHARKHGYLVSPVVHPLDAVALPGPLAREIDQFPEVVLRMRATGLAVSPAEQTQVADALLKLAGSDSTRLIVDLCVTPAAWTDANIKSFATELGTLKGLGFDHIHLSSGAFPDGLANVKGSAVIARLDWDLWQAVNAQTPKLLLGYSDYGPLTPKWTEQVLVRRGSRVAIRYARDNDWLVLRATGNKVTDSIAISQLMLGPYRTSFKGPGFSFGDMLIDQRADPTVPLNKKKSGQIHITEYWTHHIAKVVKEQY
jgi:hypothetical protein